MLDRLDETIVAVSSAPGRGALGIVRVSGSQALSIADRVAKVGTPLASQRGWTRVAGEVRVSDEVSTPDATPLPFREELGEGQANAALPLTLPFPPRGRGVSSDAPRGREVPSGALSVPAWFYVFRRPHSYTRDDLVEVHTLGSPVVLEMVRQRLLTAGAVAAEPGEFTARAFLAGGMDLTQAEAVAGIIRAQTDTQLRAARRLMDGALAAPIVAASEQLTELTALVEAQIDFSEEPIEFITPIQLRTRLTELAGQLRRLRTEGLSAERLQELPHVLLLGSPNVGKSTLLNALSGTPRAICAAAAGTTRDILSVPVRLGAGEAMLLDAAGLDQTVDEVLAQARVLTLAAAARVDLICLVADAGAPGGALGDVVEHVRALESPRVVIAANKCDLLGPAEQARRVRELAELRLGAVCPVSALTQAGLVALREELAGVLYGPRGAGLTVEREALVLSGRHREALDEAVDALVRAIELSRATDAAELVAFELRTALNALGQITGAVATEDLLSLVFSRFCIGK